MKNRSRQRKQNRSQRATDRKPEELTTFLFGTLKSFLTHLFEIWKTFPEAVRTTILLSLMGTVMAVFWTRDRVPTSQAPTQVDKPNIQSPSEAPKPKSQPNDRQSSSVLSKRKVSSERAPVNTQNISTVAEVETAQQTLELSNYGESYRQFQTILRGLPEEERQKVLAQSQEAAQSYHRGRFREAAYLMQQAVNSK
jgi:hypothetical protein